MEKLKLLQDFANNDLNCSLYILLNGYIAYNASTSNSNSPSNSFTNTTLSYPYFFLTNCSDSTSYYTGPLQLSELYDNLTAHNDGTLLRDPFSNGFISVCYIVSAITVAAWSLVLLLVLSTTTKSRITSFLTLFYAITISVVLSKTTTLLDRQFFFNYQNADQFASEVLESNVSIAFTIIVRLLTVIAWGEILVYVFSIKRKMLIRNCTAFSFLLLLLFNVLYYAYAKEDNHSTDNYTNFHHNNGIHKQYGKVERFFEVMVCVIDLTIYCVFCVTMYCYIYWKRAFAFIGSIICLTIFTGVLLLCPIVFYLAYVISNKVNNWSSLLSYFFPVLINILVWELVYKVQKLEKINESKTILGRAISNDEFSVTNHKRAGVGNDRNGDNDNGWDPSFSSYHFKNPILKSRYRNKLKSMVRLQAIPRSSNLNKGSRDQREENGPDPNYSANNMCDIDNPDSDSETHNGDVNDNTKDRNRPRANNKVKQDSKNSITNRFTKTINIPGIRPSRNWGRGVYNINKKHKNKTKIKRHGDGIVNINDNGNNILLHNLTEIQVATPVNDTTTTTASPTIGYGSTPVNVGTNLGIFSFGNRNNENYSRNSGSHAVKESDDNNNGRNKTSNNGRHNGKEDNDDNRNYHNSSNSNIDLSLREVNDDTPSQIGSAPQETVITGAIEYQHQH